MSTFRRGLTVALLLVAAAALALTALLAVSPPWTGLGPGWQFQPATLLAPLHTYLFRQAALHTLQLAGGAALTTLALGALWARIAPSGRWGVRLALAALLMPGALTGLLWRPLFPLLWYSQAETALVATGLVIVWRAVPVAGLLLSGDRRAWPLAAAVPIWLALTDAGLTLTLTGGEPFNASHTWASWALTNLWVNRDWGHAAAMLGGLAAVTTVVMAVLFRAAGNAALPVWTNTRPHTWIAPAVWLAAPLLPWLLAHGTQLGRGFVLLLTAGAALGWVAGLATLAVVAMLARFAVVPAPTPFGLAPTVLALGAWALWPLPIAYLATVAGWPLAYLGVCALIGLTAATVAAGRPRFTLLAVCALLAQSFPLLLVLDLPGALQPPSLATVLRLGAAPTPAALAAALCCHYLIAVGCAQGVVRVATDGFRRAA